MKTLTTPDGPSLIEYPSRFPIKVMGAKVDGFVHAVTQIAKQFDPAFDATTIELRDSKAGSGRQWKPRWRMRPSSANRGAGQRRSRRWQEQKVS